MKFLNFSHFAYRTVNAVVASIIQPTGLVAFRAVHTAVIIAGRFLNIETTKRSERPIPPTNFPVAVIFIMLSNVSRAALNPVCVTIREISFNLLQNVVRYLPKVRVTPRFPPNNGIAISAARKAFTGSNGSIAYDKHTLQSLICDKQFKNCLYFLLVCFEK